MSRSPGQCTLTRRDLLFERSELVRRAYTRPTALRAAEQYLGGTNGVYIQVGGVGGAVLGFENAGLQGRRDQDRAFCRELVANL